ncbi:GNAT family N-acetyltransferase [Dyadobacter sp. LHD-138]|uniref:GNAT family N-acetyltransferase n=1 Tax=Dyadobacter sp. LHD-138 TaxID=3071413 RepID=UPI0027DFAEC9|nr:GNAT family N-acetyltransferase [Dyadobacter sp. LHD-138]MDQ6477897.1 GNAT family N-acetyltransferase [Dyadobacter sp. LHD-138]
MEFLIKRLDTSCEKKNFDCGNDLLDNYLKRQAKQDVSRDLSACFVLVDRDKIVKGYYTLSASSVQREDFPEELQNRLPPGYLDLPTVLLGRLATDKSIQGQGYGGIMLLSALNKCLELSENLGTLAVIVDPVDSNAVRFYEKYGFIYLPGTGKMFIPMKTIRQLPL